MLALLCALLDKVCERSSARAVALLSACNSALLSNPALTLDAEPLTADGRDPFSVAVRVMHILVLQCVSEGGWRDAELLLGLVSRLVPAMSEQQKQDSEAWCAPPLSEHPPPAHRRLIPAGSRVGFASCVPNRVSIKSGSSRPPSICGFG